MNGRPAAWIVLLLALAHGGCVSYSQYRDKFVPCIAGGQKYYPPTSQVEIRNVAWQNWEVFNQEDSRLREKSQVRETARIRQERCARLFHAVQFPENPQSYALIGISRFSADSYISESDTNMDEFARQIGADLVFWSYDKRYHGRKVVDLAGPKPPPAAADRDEDDDAPDEKDNAIPPDATAKNPNGHSGTKAMKVSRADETYEYVGIFLRKLRPGETFP